jgi:formate-dependent nitrite reductase membrane component NrfD
VPHLPLPWGGKVAAYLWTKAIAAGALMLGALGTLAGGTSFLTGVLCPLMGLVFLALTTALLIADLKRPDRFHYLLLRPNPRSWLVKGTWILLASAAITTVWLIGGITRQDALLRVLALPTLLLGAATAGYSAFLFGQAEGRDFWQSPLLLPHLLAGAIVAGAAALILVVAFIAGVLNVQAPALQSLRVILMLGLVAHGVILIGELGGFHPTLDAARAARLITRGPWRGHFWGLVVIGGVVLPFVLARSGEVWLMLGAVLALVGLWVYEAVWVKAGQSIPLS